MSGSADDDGWGPANERRAEEQRALPDPFELDLPLLPDEDPDGPDPGVRECPGCGWPLLEGEVCEVCYGDEIDWGANP